MAVVEGNRENIKDLIKDHNIVIFDFWAEWCAPCKRFSPIFEAVAAKNPDILFVKINTDLEQEISAVFEIRSIPTIAVIKEQDIILAQPGSVSEEILEQIVAKARDVDMAVVRSQSET